VLPCVLFYTQIQIQKYKCNKNQNVW